MRQLIGGNGQDRRGGGDRIQAQRCADLFSYRGGDPFQGCSVGDPGQPIGIEAPKQKIGVGNGGGSAASAIRDRPGAGAGAFRPDLQ